MAAGRTPSFCDTDEHWESYQERLECYFAVNKTEEAVKVQTLIMGLSAVQYQTLRNLMAPHRPATQTYEVL